jgi:hypothetical protein
MKYFFIIPISAFCLLPSALAQTIQPPANRSQVTNMVANGYYVSPAGLGDFYNYVLIPYVAANAGGNTNALTAGQAAIVTAAVTNVVEATSNAVVSHTLYVRTNYGGTVTLTNTTGSAGVVTGSGSTYGIGTNTAHLVGTNDARYLAALTNAAAFAPSSVTNYVLPDYVLTNTYYGGNATGSNDLAYLVSNAVTNGQSAVAFNGTNTSGSAANNVGDSLDIVGANGAGVSVFPFTVNRYGTDSVGRFVGLNYRTAGVFQTNKNTGAYAYLEITAGIPSYGRLLLRNGDSTQAITLSANDGSGSFTGGLSSSTFTDSTGQLPPANTILTNGALYQPTNATLTELSTNNGFSLTNLNATNLVGTLPMGTLTASPITTNGFLTSDGTTRTYSKNGVNLTNLTADAGVNIVTATATNNQTANSITLRATNAVAVIAGVTITNSTITSGVITASSTIQNTSGQIISAGGFVPDRANQDCSMVRVGVGTIRIRTNAVIEGTLTATNGITVPNGVTLGSGTTTSAPILFSTNSTLLSTITPGAMEYVHTNRAFYATSWLVRRTIPLVQSLAWNGSAVNTNIVITNTTTETVIYQMTMATNFIPRQGGKAWDINLAGRHWSGNGDGFVLRAYIGSTAASNLLFTLPSSTAGVKAGIPWKYNSMITAATGDGTNTTFYCNGHIENNATTTQAAADDVIKNTLTDANTMFITISNTATAGDSTSLRQGWTTVIDQTPGQ